MSRPPMGERLVQAGYITTCQLQSALAFQRGWDGRIALEAALVKLGFLSASQALEVARTLAGDRRAGGAEAPTEPGAQPAANDAAKDVPAAA